MLAETTKSNLRKSAKSAGEKTTLPNEKNKSARKKTKNQIIFLIFVLLK